MYVHSHLCFTSLRVPVPTDISFFQILDVPSVVQVSPSGEVLASLWDQQGEAVAGASSVEEHGGRLWLGNLRGSGVGYYDLKPSLSSAGSES